MYVLHGPRRPVNVGSARLSGSWTTTRSSPPVRGHERRGLTTHTASHGQPAKLSPTSRRPVCALVPTCPHPHIAEHCSPPLQHWSRWWVVVSQHKLNGGEGLRNPAVRVAAVCSHQQPPGPPGLVQAGFTGAWSPLSSPRRKASSDVGCRAPRSPGLAAVGCCGERESVILSCRGALAQARLTLAFEQ